MSGANGSRQLEGPRKPDQLGPRDQAGLMLQFPMIPRVPAMCSWGDLTAMRGGRRVGSASRYEALVPVLLEVGRQSNWTRMAEKTKTRKKESQCQGTTTVG